MKSFIVRAAFLALLASGGVAAQTQSERTDLHVVPVDQLEAMYLRCERSAASGLVDVADAAQCSLVGRELLGRAFDGDFSRLLQWWRQARTGATPCADPRATPGPEQCDQG
jgi:hypothetical protein